MGFPAWFSQTQTEIKQRPRTAPLLEERFLRIPTQKPTRQGAVSRPGVPGSQLADASFWGDRDKAPIPAYRSSPQRLSCLLRKGATGTVNSGF